MKLSDKLIALRKNAAILLFVIVMVYIFYINPKYMNRQLTKKRTPKD